MEGLDLDNILDVEDVNLFNDEETQEVEEETPDSEENEKEETTEINQEELFDGESESVGSGNEDNEEEEDTHSSKGDSTSPKNNFFSSIAEAFAEEGILPNLDEDSIKNINTAEDFRQVIDDYIKSELDEQQQRIKEALDNNVPNDEIRQYESILGYLDSISEETLRSETDQSEELRKRLLFQDYINRGFDQKRAEREVNKAIQNGTDIDDALEALDSCKDFYKDAYNGVLNNAREKKRAEEEEIKQRAANLKNSIFDKKSKFFDDIELDKGTRQKIYDNITKPIYKDKETGEVFTAIQKYEMENRDEFIAKLGLLFTLTDGFKSIDRLVNGKVKKEIKRGLRDLENKINNTSRDSSGSLRFTSGVDDSESYLGKGLKLAL